MVPLRFLLSLSFCSFVASRHTAARLIPSCADTLRPRVTLESLLECEDDPESVLDLISDDEEPADLLPGHPRRSPPRAGGRFAMGLADDGGSGSEEWVGPSIRWWARGELTFASGIAASGMIEKDAGERSDLATISGFVRWRGILPGVDLCLGDYRFTPGSGLLFGGALSHSGPRWLSGRERHSEPGIRPHRSRNEVDFFRGLSCSWNPTPASALLIWLSDRRLFGRKGEGGFQIDPSGTFRSSSDLSRRSPTRERGAGLSCRALLFGLVEVGASLVSLSVQDPLDLTRYALPPSSRFFYLQSDASLRYLHGEVRWEFLRGGRGGWGEVIEWRHGIGDGWHLLRIEGRSRDFMIHRSSGSETGDVAVRSFLEFPVGPSMGLTSFLEHRRQMEPRAGEFGRMGRTTVVTGIRWEIAPGHDIGLEYLRTVKEEQRLTESSGGWTQRCLLTLMRHSIRLRLSALLAGRLEWRMNLALAEYREEGGGVRTGGSGMRQELSWAPWRWCGLAVGTTIAAGSSPGGAVYFLDPDPIRGGTLHGYSGKGESHAVRLLLRAGRWEASFFALCRNEQGDPWLAGSEDRMFGMRVSFSR